MKASKLLEILELGIPVIGKNHIYRLIDNKLQIGVAYNKEPAYIGNHIENLLELANELTKEAEIQLIFIKVQVAQKNSSEAKTFDYEKDYFKQLECDVPKDLSFSS